ncbi:MAG: hypothetical protein KC983_09095 [Phycisphaerales bacterium]|nr:hypothetical protein [Phycisphaerales bacterium]
MENEVTAILFGGTLRPTRLREALDCPVLALPCAVGRTLADIWLDRLIGEARVGQVRAVLNTEEDVREVLESAAWTNSDDADGESFIGLTDPAAWRGAGGILYDVTRDLASEAIVIVGEGHRLPPATIGPILSSFDDPAVDGVVGVCGFDEPAGVYAFRRRVIDAVSEIGYCDLKEQMLPLLSQAGHHLATARLGDRAMPRLHDRVTYLRAVSSTLRGTAAGRQAIAADARVDTGALLDGFCLIDADAIVEAGAVIHDAVILAGATIGEGAVVSDSVIGPSAVVAPGRRVIASMHAVPRRVPSLTSGRRSTSVALPTGGR